jgi:hypothetical protein
VPQHRDQQARRSEKVTPGAVAHVGAGFERAAIVLGVLQRHAWEIATWPVTCARWLVRLLQRATRMLELKPPAEYYFRFMRGRRSPERETVSRCTVPGSTLARPDRGASESTRLDQMRGTPRGRERSAHSHVQDLVPHYKMTITFSPNVGSSIRAVSCALQWSSEPLGASHRPCGDLQYMSFEG